MSKKKSNATRRAEQRAAQERAAEVRRAQQRKERRRRNALVVGGIVAVLALVVGIGYAVQSSRDTTGQTTEPPAGAVDDYALPRGSQDAPVTVTIYEDFMCPFCGQFEAASRSVLSSYVDAGDARVEYRVLSFLDRTSNGTDYSTRSMSALGVVLDTAGPEVALAFHDALFENQPEEGSDGLSDAELVDLAVDAGANRGDVTTPIEERAFEQWVRNATDAANQGRGLADPDGPGGGRAARGHHDRRAGDRARRGGAGRARGLSPVGAMRRPARPGRMGPCPSRSRRPPPLAPVPSGSSSPASRRPRSTCTTSGRPRRASSPSWRNATRAPCPPIRMRCGSSTGSGTSRTSSRSTSPSST